VANSQGAARLSELEAQEWAYFEIVERVPAPQHGDGGVCGRGKTVALLRKEVTA